MKHILPWSPKKYQSHCLVPVFIPFAGCPTRCIFCAQDIQSGTKQRSISLILAELEQSLIQRQEAGLKAPELGFFGGTFTAIAPVDFSLCCNFVHSALLANRISGARCSTRPDALNPIILSTLKQSGFKLVELGIQSFNNQALTKAKRNYSSTIAKDACEQILEHDLSLGIQLMPGMPGVDYSIFLQDVKIALNFQASTLRFYPCQVLKGTSLAKLWDKKEYEPWLLEPTIKILAKAWLMAHKKQVAVIRMGLAPEPDLEQAILAGPRHPALGSLVKAQALLDYVQDALNGNIIKSITFPKECQGFLGGHKNMLLQKWEKIGLNKTNTHWNNSQCINIITE